MKPAPLKSPWVSSSSLKLSIFSSTPSRSRRYLSCTAWGKKLFTSRCVDFEVPANSSWPLSATSRDINPGFHKARHSFGFAVVITKWSSFIMAPRHSVQVILLVRLLRRAVVPFHCLNVALANKTVGQAPESTISADGIPVRIFIVAEHSKSGGPFGRRRKRMSSATGISSSSASRLSSAMCNSGNSPPKRRGGYPGAGGACSNSPNWARMGTPAQAPGVYRRRCQAPAWQSTFQALLAQVGHRHVDGEILFTSPTAASLAGEAACRKGPRRRK